MFNTILSKFQQDFFQLQTRVLQNVDWKEEKQGDKTILKDEKEKMGGITVPNFMTIYHSSSTV